MALRILSHAHVIVWTDHEFVKLSTYIGGDPEDVVEHPVSRRTDGSKDAGIFSEKEVSMPSNEVRNFYFSFLT